MAIRFQYNKTSLQQQEKALKMRLRTLPTIKSKESALRQQVKQTKREVDLLEEKLEQELRGYQGMVSLWDEFDASLITFAHHCRSRGSVDEEDCRGSTPSA